MTFRDRLKTAMTRSGFSQRALAAATGLSDSYVSHLVSGTRVPSERTIRDLARATGVPTEWLTSGEDAVPPTSQAVESPVSTLLVLIASRGARGLSGEAERRYHERLEWADSRLNAYAEDLRLQLEDFLALLRCKR